MVDFVAHWSTLTERPLTDFVKADVELVLQRARERHPGARPRVISDNGPQFVAGDFRRFIDITGMTHVRTSPYYSPSARCAPAQCS